MTRSGGEKGAEGRSRKKPTRTGPKRQGRGAAKKKPPARRSGARAKSSPRAAARRKGGRPRGKGAGAVTRGESALQRVLTALQRPPRAVAFAMVGEAIGERRDLAVFAETVSMADAGGGRGDAALERRRTALRGRIALAVGAMSALGHKARVTLMVRLLEGPATYRAIRQATRLKAGPLYHHVHHLRLAGLLRPKERDLYELTRSGRNMLLIALAASGMIADQRARPVGPQLST